jgi:hypothetical protein
MIVDTFIKTKQISLIFPVLFVFAIDYVFVNEIVTARLELFNAGVGHPGGEDCICIRIIPHFNLSLRLYARGHINTDQQ